MFKDKQLIIIKSKNFDEWEKYYFKNAKQNKKNGKKITKECITDLGKTVFKNLNEVVKIEASSISEEECIDYMWNLVLNRTYEGYFREIELVTDQLSKILNIEIIHASDEWDRIYSVDYYIEVNGKFIGLQVKPTTGIALDEYKWDMIQETTHEKFTEDFGGKVFFVYSIKKDGKKVIRNKEVIEEIKEEIKRLSN